MRSRQVCSDFMSLCSRRSVSCLDGMYFAECLMGVSLVFWLNVTSSSLKIGCGLGKSNFGWSGIDFH